MSTLTLLRGHRNFSTNGECDISMVTGICGPSTGDFVFLWSLFSLALLLALLASETPDGDWAGLLVIR